MPRKEKSKESFTGRSPRAELTIFTVGHSTRSAEEFGAILNSHGVKTLVDVRSFPGSRRYPQFNKERLAAFLASINVNYHHMPKLGGRRRPTPESRNTAWKNASFRAYADHMERPEFKEGIKELLELARTERIAIMCAESLWWRCHRSLIADYLKAIGVEVGHIADEKKVDPHPFTSAARIVDGCLSYQGLI
jgi:uncharacterized protein (DUF488 family)